VDREVCKEKTQKSDLNMILSGFEKAVPAVINCPNSCGD